MLRQANEKSLLSAQRNYERAKGDLLRAGISDQEIDSLLRAYQQEFSNNQSSSGQSSSRVYQEFISKPHEQEEYYFTQIEEPRNSV